MAKVIIHPDEKQIVGQGAYPLIDGEAFPGVTWYRIGPEKVTICTYAGSEMEEIREYDIRRLTLSGFLTNQSVKDFPVMRNRLGRHWLKAHWISILAIVSALSAIIRTL